MNMNIMSLCYCTQACFELVCAATSVMEAEVVPVKKFILSLISVLSHLNGQCSAFRYL